MATISIKELLEAGVHFGHQTGRWNPKMQPFIFGEKNGVHIVDLQKTIRCFKEAVDFITSLAAQGKTILFVGTKGQARETIEEEARRCGMYWITNRWLGGLLTNFTTVQNSIKRYRELETKRDDGFYEKLSKKEVARLERERKKLEKNLRGIRDIDRCPDALFIVDSRQEAIAVQEAAKLNIPIIAIVDTNSDPDLIDYVIPGNDDALRSVQLFAGTVADAILAGKSVYTAQVETELRKAEEKAAKAAKEEAQRKAAAAKEAKKAARLSGEGQEAERAGDPISDEVSAASDKPSEGLADAPKVAEFEKLSVSAEVEEKKKSSPEETPVVVVDQESQEVPAEKKDKSPAKKAKPKVEKVSAATKVKKSAKKSKTESSKNKKTASTKSKVTKGKATKSKADTVKKSLPEAEKSEGESKQSKS